MKDKRVQNNKHTHTKYARYTERKKANKQERKSFEYKNIKKYIRISKATSLRVPILMLTMNN